MSDDRYLLRKERAETTTSPLVLRGLANGEWHPEVRAAVAANQHTPSDVLSGLASPSERVEVRLAVLRNPTASDELKAHVARSCAHRASRAPDRIDGTG